MKPISRIEFEALPLSELAADLHGNNVMITGLSDDCRHIQPGDAFLCMPRTGTRRDEFAEIARSNGAEAVIAVGQLPATELPTLRLDDLNEVGSMLRRLLHTDDFSLHCIGVTGTDGKTSIAWMLREALARKLGRVWSTGTLGLVTAADDIRDIGNTTPSMLTSHKLMQQAIDSGVAALVMEVSSHGIEQQRIAGLPIDTAIWTNLGHDHLQDHGGFEAYATVKQRFVMERMAQGGLAICNADDADIRRLMLNVAPDVSWYGHGLYAHEHDGITVELTWEQELPGMVRLSFGADEVLIEDIPSGDFHAENLAAVALTLIRRFNVSLSELPELLGGISAPPGRMQPLEIGRWQVFIDYAHTPEALERCLDTARKLTAGRLTVVFGCGGNRDREKRPEMGHVAVTMADRVWITSDNPRSERPEVIASEIENGMPKPYPAEVYLELDRRQAIFDAVDALQPGDLLVIAGKGHEAYMETEGVRTVWSDFDIAADALHLKEDRRMRQCA